MSDLSLYEDTLKFYFVLSEGSDQWDDFHPMKYAKQVNSFFFVDQN